MVPISLAGFNSKIPCVKPREICHQLSLEFTTLLRYGPPTIAVGLKDMAHSSIPHFHNTDGVAQIEVGAKEFMCVGALPPFDHPHIYLDMGDENDIVCSYCSTHYVYNSSLAATAAKPATAVFISEKA
jgi:uncharacterized Zn-finger protein